MGGALRDLCGQSRESLVVGIGGVVVALMQLKSVRWRLIPSDFRGEYHLPGPKRQHVATESEGVCVCVSLAFCCQSECFCLYVCLAMMQLWNLQLAKPP